MRGFKLLILLILFILSNSISVFADESVPFQLVESTPPNNSTEVTTNPEIKLLFNKNVVNFSVKENNSKCIKMFDEKNNEISVELVFPDDQVEPEKKREIYVKPIEYLLGNAKYTIEVSGDMMAKNGSLLGNNVYIAFTTIAAGSQLEEVPVIPEQNLSEALSQVPVEKVEDNNATTEKDIFTPIGETEKTETLPDNEVKEETKESEASDKINNVTNSDNQNSVAEENSQSIKETNNQEAAKEVNSKAGTDNSSKKIVGIAAILATVIIALILIKLKKSKV